MQVEPKKENTSQETADTEEKDPRDQDGETGRAECDFTITDFASI